MRPRVSWRAPAEAAVGEADAAVQTETVLLAARAVRVLRAALVAVEASPARPARALAVHRVAAEAALWVAGAGRLAAETVEAVGAEALGAAVAREAVFAQTRAVGRKAAGARGAVAGLGTVLPEAAHRALFPAPLTSVARSTVALPSKSVTEATIVAATFLGTVGSMEALWAGQGTDGAHPAWWTAAGTLGDLEDTSILASIGAGTEETRRVLWTGYITAGSRSPWGADAGTILGVTGCPMALAAKLAGRAIAARRAGLKAVWGLQAREARTRPTLRVTGAAVAAGAAFVTLLPPHSWGTLTGAVVTPPAWCTLALIGSHTAAMDTLLGTEWDTGSSATLVEAPAALQAWSGVCLHHLPVHCPVDNPGLGAGVGVLPGPVTRLSRGQAEGT